MEYRRDIDGLRAIAVLVVLLCHARIAGFSGGYVGVDVFFVISGYLITGIIAREMDAGQFSLLSFYERRARRILPALIPVIVITLAVGWVTLMPLELKRLGRSALATSLFASNFHFLRSLDYFLPLADFEPLLHTWSLAVEEQFYLFFPPMLMALAALGRSRWMLPGIALASALSLAGAALLLERWPDYVFYLIVFRAWELGAGAMLALARVPLPQQRAARELVGALGLAAILLPVWHYTADTPFPGLAAVPPVLGAAALIWIGGAARGSVVTRILSIGPLVAVGLVSYSLYLWHWPIFAYLRLLESGSQLAAPVIAAALAGSLAIAWLSYRFIEQPFRRRAHPTPQRRTPQRLALLSAAVGVLVVPGAVGEVWHDAEGVPERLPPGAQRIAAVGNDSNPDRHHCMARLPGPQLCPVGLPAAPDRPLRFVLLGDSHAEMLRAGVDAAARAAGQSGIFAGKVGCVPMPDIERMPLRTDCVGFNDSLRKWLDARPAIDTVIIAVRWTVFVEGDGIGVERNTMIGWRWIGDPAVRPAATDNAALIEAGLARYVDALAARGRRVVLVGPVPEVGYRLPLDMARRLTMGLLPRPERTATEHQARTERTEALLRRIAARSPKVHYIPLADLFCDAQGCRSRKADGTPFYIDDDHITRSTALTLLRPRLDRIWAQDPR